MRLIDVSLHAACQGTASGTDCCTWFPTICAGNGRIELLLQRRHGRTCVRARLILRIANAVLGFHAQQVVNVIVSKADCSSGRTCLSGSGSIIFRRRPRISLICTGMGTRLSVFH